MKVNTTIPAEWVGFLRDSYRKASKDAWNMVGLMQRDFAGHALYKAFADEMDELLKGVDPRPPKSGDGR